MQLWVPGVVTARTPLGQHVAFALSRGITVTIGRETLEWLVSTDDPAFPEDQTNFVIAVAQTVAPSIVPHMVTIESDLPAGVGLGSSNAAVAAGILMAEKLRDHHVNTTDKLAIAATFEPNEAANRAILLGGGLFLADPVATATPLQLQGLQAVAYLPTNAAQPAAPSHYAEAVDHEALAHLPAGDTAWLAGHLPLTPLTAQLSTEYYPHAEMVARAVKAAGGYGCFLAGNGPTLICVAPGQDQAFVAALNQRLHAGHLLPLHLSTTGATVTQA